MHSHIRCDTSTHDQTPICGWDKGQTDPQKKCMVFDSHCPHSTRVIESLAEAGYATTFLNCPVSHLPDHPEVCVCMLNAGDRIDFNEFD